MRLFAYTEKFKAMTLSFFRHKFLYNCKFNMFEETYLFNYTQEIFYLDTMKIPVFVPSPEIKI